MNSVTATFVENIFDSEIDGAYKFEDDNNIIYICPCGCKELMSLPVVPLHISGQRGWGWNQNKDKPTLTPSIRRMDGCKFHGFLTDGVWTGNNE